MYKSSSTRTLITVGIAASAALLLSACGSGSPVDAETLADTAGSDHAATFDQELHDLLPDSIKKSGTIRSAGSMTETPFIFKPDGKEAIGIVPDLAAKVSDVLGVEIEIVDTPFPATIPGLQADRFDITWALMRDTAEREEILDFINYIRTTAGLMVKKGNPDNLDTIDSLCGHSIGSVRGDSNLHYIEAQSEACVADGEQPIEVKLYDSAGDGQTQIRSDNLDAWFGGTTALAYLASHADDGDAFEILDGIQLGNDSYGIATLKGNDELVQALHGALLKIEEDGSYLDVLSEYDAEADALTPDEMVINGVGEGLFK